MFCYRKVLQWFFSVFLICSPVPHLGRSIDGSSRTRRSVTHAQLMHDKGRALQDFRRRLWLQELLEEVHTAEVRDPPARPGPPGGTAHSKPPGGTKELPLSFLLEEQPAPNPPQETLKAPSHKDGPPRAPGRRRKKGRGRRREGDKRRRRVRSLGRRREDHIHLDPRPEDHIHLDPRPEDHIHLDRRPEDHIHLDPRPEDHIHLDPRPEDHIHLGWSSLLGLQRALL